MDDAAEVEMQALGVSDESIADLRESASENDQAFLVYPCNWPTVQVFQKLSGSWNVAVGLSGMIYLGLKIEAIESAMRMMRIPEVDQMDVFDGIIVMQGVAREVLNSEQ